jgi:hypothetical protein
MWRLPRGLQMTDEKPLSNSALLHELRADIKVIRAELAVVTDHETRIRDLEKARYQSAWVTSILSATLSSGVVFFIIKLIGG